MERSRDCRASFCIKVHRGCRVRGVSGLENVGGSLGEDGIKVGAAAADQ